MYDPQIGRTWQRDPHASTYAGISPYSFLGNNPIRYIDPTGMDQDETSWGGGGSAPVFGPGIKNLFSNQGSGSSGGLVYDWSKGIYTLNGNPVSHAYAMSVIKMNSTYRDQALSFNDYYPEFSSKSIGAITSGMGVHIINVGQFNTENVLQQGGTQYKFNSNNPNYTDRVGGLDYVGYVNELAGYAAGLTAKDTYKYAQGAKTAAQRTAENAKLFTKVASKLTIAGGAFGAVDSYNQAYQDFSNGDYALGAYETLKGASYTAGTAMLFSPLAPIGAGILTVTGIIDIIGDASLYIYGKNR